MSFEANKIIGAVLAAMILAMVSGIVSNILVHPTKLDKPVFAIAGVAETASPAGGSAAPAGPEPIGALMATADAEAGKAKTQQCAACHTFDKGAPNRVGPNLWGVIGDEIAHDRGGFAFSAALTAKGGEWTVDKLNEWLWKPQNFAKGTKMTFIGLAKPQDRANVIAYLNAESDNPKPLASLVGTAAVAPAAAPAEGKAAAPAEAPAAPAGDTKPAAPAAN
jgi:cytochrome c